MFQRSKDTIFFILDMYRTHAFVYVIQCFSIRDLSKDFYEMDDRLPKGQHGKCNNCAPMMDQDASSAFLFFNPSY